MDAVLQLSPTVGVESACNVLGVARASFYRQRPLLGPAVAIPFLAPAARPAPARALSLDVTGHDICPRHSHNNSGLAGQIGIGSGCRTWSWGGIGYLPV